jgi:hypothetical protein
MKWLIALLALFAFSASAADVAGKWKATSESPNGTVERTFDFKVDGARLTGETVSSMMGKSTLMDGKVDGNNISFSITIKFQDNEMKVDYKGKVTGDEIALTATIAGMDQKMEFKGKRIP